MREIVSPLTADEHAVLLIAAQDQWMIDMGENSRWSAPIQSLARRGYLNAMDKFNVIITPAGRAALGEYEKAEDAALGRAIDRARLIDRALAPQDDAPIDDAPLGPSVVGGRLFFKLSDGTTIQCTCIGEPYASQIVEAWRQR